MMLHTVDLTTRKSYAIGERFGWGVSYPLVHFFFIPPCAFPSSKVIPLPHQCRRNHTPPLDTPKQGVLVLIHQPMNNPATRRNDD